MSAEAFKALFKRATGHEPYSYQIRLATAGELPQLIDIPTGAGKTAAVVMAWVWRRNYTGDRTRGMAWRKRLSYMFSHLFLGMMRSSGEAA